MSSFSKTQKEDEIYQVVENERQRRSALESGRCSKRRAALVEEEGKIRWIVRDTRREPQSADIFCAALAKKINRNRTKNLPEIASFWYTIVGEEIARQTRVVSFRNGTLHVAVHGAPLRQELEAFHGEALLDSLRQGWPVNVPLRNLKFALDIP